MPSPGEACRIVLADDHRLVREGLRRLLADRPEWKVVGEACTGKELLEILRKTPWDLIVCDLSMPDLSGLEALDRIEAEWPAARVVVLTMHKGPLLFRKATAHTIVKGYVLKDDAFTQLDQVLRKVWANEKAISEHSQGLLLEDYRALHQGNRDLMVLSRREQEVLRLVAAGLTAREVAKQLFLSVRTVESHRARIMEKLQIKGTAELVRFALEHGIQ